jgi:hypothetical protein
MVYFVGHISFILSPSVLQSFLSVGAEQRVGIVIRVWDENHTRRGFDFRQEPDKFSFPKPSI